MTYDISLRYEIGEYPFEHISEVYNTNIAYNLSKYHYNIFGNDGIRKIYGMKAIDSVPVLEDAISKLGDDATNDCWEATEGNAKRPLLEMLEMAKKYPSAVWSGD